MYHLVGWSVTAAEGWRWAILRSCVTDRYRADRRKLGGYVERFAKLGLIRNAEEHRAEARIDCCHEDKHRRHAGIDIPVRNWPSSLVHVRPAFVRLRVSQLVPTLVTETNDQQRRLEHVGPAELLAHLRGPERVPVAGRLLGALEREERPALSEPRGRRPLRVGEDPVDHLARDAAVLEAADHLPFADDVLELHQVRR